MPINFNNQTEIQFGQISRDQRRSKLYQRSKSKIDLEKPIEHKTNQHMIDKIPIGQRYQNGNRIPINQ